MWPSDEFPMQEDKQGEGYKDYKKIIRQFNNLSKILENYKTAHYITLQIVRRKYKYYRRAALCMKFMIISSFIIAIALILLKLLCSKSAIWCNVIWEMAGIVLIIASLFVRSNDKFYSQAKLCTKFMIISSFIGAMALILLRLLCPELPAVLCNNTWVIAIVLIAFLTVVSVIYVIRDVAADN